MTRIWFAGSGAFAAACLSRISEDISIDLVITGVPATAGRGLRPQPTEVDLCCEGRNFDVRRTERLMSDASLIDRLSDCPPDIFLVVDFGQKILPPFLDLPHFGCLNIHPSLLPRHRGAAPVQRAILAGERRSGVTLFRLVEAMDAGPILSQECIDISEGMTAGEFAAICAEKGSELFLKGVKSIIDGSCMYREQNSESASYAPKIQKSESLIDWRDRSVEIHDRVRAFNPAPGAYFMFLGKRVKVWRTKCVPASGRPGEYLGLDEKGFPLVASGEGALVLSSVQPEGKRVLEGSDWMRGIRIEKGAVLG